MSSMVAMVAMVESMTQALTPAMAITAATTIETLAKRLSEMEWLELLLVEARVETPSKVPESTYC
jgi:hypothetical protein